MLAGWGLLPSFRQMRGLEAERGCAPRTALSPCLCRLSLQPGQLCSRHCARPKPWPGPRRSDAPTAEPETLSVQHLHGSWTAHCLRLPPSSTSPSKFALSGWAPTLCPRPTDCTFSACYYIASATVHRYEPPPDRCDPVPSAARQPWEPPVPKHGLKPPSHNSSAGAGTTPRHQGMSQLTQHVREMTVTARSCSPQAGFTC